MRAPARVGKRLRGRRLGDPVDIATTPGTRAVRGRLAAVSVRAALAAGAWVGFALGLVFGAVAGAAIVWFAGSVVDWQRDLAFTLGVTRRLLPFGDQIGLLRDIEARWWLVIPGVAIAVAVLAALIGALLGGIFAALYNRSPRHALLVVELPTSLPNLPPPAGDLEALDGSDRRDGVGARHGGDRPQGGDPGDGSDPRDGRDVRDAAGRTTAG